MPHRTCFLLLLILTSNTALASTQARQEARRRLWNDQNKVSIFPPGKLTQVIRALGANMERVVVPGNLTNAEAALGIAATATKRGVSPQDGPNK